MTMQPLEPTGLFDVRYAAFLETIVHVRARLHRYCARMTGSVLDGEDVMQEALFEAYKKIKTLEDPGAMRPWLFRIAHNRCIDFLRTRHARERAETDYSETASIAMPDEPVGSDARHAIERLVIRLPPMERACVLLKDVFDYSLEETANLVDSTVGGVKAALSRGRARLALPMEPLRQAERRLNPQAERLLRRYIELFNRRDWDGVRALTSADAQLQVADCFRGRLVDSPYLVEYERQRTPWRFELGKIDGETVLIVLLRRGDNWEPRWPVRIRVSDEVIDRISDYYACPWVVPAAFSVTFESRSLADTQTTGH
jgi:RNA polymerase sigma-70 factor, ECF subfamily